MRTIDLLIMAGAVALCGCSHAGKVADSVTGVSVTDYRDGKEAAISFTYDDGTLCHYLEVAPELEKRGLRGTFWIVGANIGTESVNYPYMNWEQVAELSRRGHEVSNHSWTHPHLTDLPPDRLRQEIELCDSAILAATGKRPVTFCYPFNAYNDEVLAAASAGRVGTRTYWDAQGQEVSGCTDESLAQWLDSTIVHKGWAVTMTHSMSYGWDKWDDPQVLWRLYDRVKERESEVWVGTFAEVAAYQKEKDGTTLSMEKRRGGITVTPETELDTTLFAEPLTMRVDGDFASATATATQDGQPLDVTNRGDHLLINFIPGGGAVEIDFD